MIQTGQFRSRQNFWAQPAPQNRDANSIVLRDECARFAHRSGSCPASVFGWRLGTSQELGCAALTRIELEHCSILRLVLSDRQRHGPCDVRRRTGRDAERAQGTPRLAFDLHERVEEDRHKVATPARLRAMAARERHVARIVGRADAALQLGSCRAILKDRIATRRASWHGFLFSPGGSADRPKYAEYQLRYERRHQSNHLPSIIFRLLPAGRVNCTTRSPLSATFACCSASRIAFSSSGSWKGLRRIGTRAVCTTSL